MLGAEPLTPDTLACAFVLAGTCTPAPAQLAEALAELFPDGTGPTVTDVLAAGLLVPTVDKQGLRVPPLQTDIHRCAPRTIGRNTSTANAYANGY